MKPLFLAPSSHASRYKKVEKIKINDFLLSVFVLLAENQMIDEDQRISSFSAWQKPFKRMCGEGFWLRGGD